MSQLSDENSAFGGKGQYFQASSVASGCQITAKTSSSVHDPDNISAYLNKQIYEYQCRTIKKSLIKAELSSDNSWWVPRIHFSQCVLPLLLSTWTVYLHATKAHSNVIDQYYSDYKWTTNGLQMETRTLPVPQSCPVGYRFWIHMLISVYRDYNEHKNTDMNLPKFI